MVTALSTGEAIRGVASVDSCVLCRRECVLACLRCQTTWYLLRKAADRVPWKKLGSRVSGGRRHSRDVSSGPFVVRGRQYTCALLTYSFLAPFLPLLMFGCLVHFAGSKILVAMNNLCFGI